MGLSQRRRVPVYGWAVARALPVIPPSSLQRALSIALPSSFSSQNVPNSRVPRTDLARKLGQGLLRVSECLGLVHAALRAYSFTPCFSFPNSAHTVFCTLATLRQTPPLGAPGIRDDAVVRPGLKEFPAGLRLAGRRLHPKPKSQAATGSSQRCELQVPPSFARALPPLPHPTPGPPVSRPRVPPIGLSALSVAWEY